MIGSSFTASNITLHTIVLLQYTLGCLLVYLYNTLTGIQYYMTQHQYNNFDSWYYKIFVFHIPIMSAHFSCYSWGRLEPLSECSNFKIFVNIFRLAGLFHCSTWIIIISSWLSSETNNNHFIRLFQFYALRLSFALVFVPSFSYTRLRWARALGGLC